MKFKLPKFDLKKVDKIEIAKVGLTVVSGMFALASSHLDDIILNKKIKNEVSSTVVSTIASLGKKK